MTFMSILLAGLLICVTTTRPAYANPQPGQAERRVQKIKSEVGKRGVGESARIEVRLQDGTKLKGYVRQADENGFVVLDTKTASESAVTYNQVDSIKGKGLSLGAKIGIGIGIAAAALVALALGALAYGGD